MTSDCRVAILEAASVRVARMGMMSNGDPGWAVQKIRVELGEVRKRSQALYDQLRTTNENAKEIARNELCRALVARLDLAEREASELADMISLAQTS
jgi:hypothetical protein